MTRLADDAVRAARQASIAQYLVHRGHRLERDGRQFRLPDHGGLVISGHMWHCFSTGEGGNAVDLLTRVFRLPFREAVEQLLEVESTGLVTEASPKSALARNRCCDGAPGHFRLPPPATCNARVTHYLTRHRALAEHLVDKIIGNGLVYEDTRGNVVFVCRDISGEPRAALLRGTDPERRFVGMVPHSDSRYGWHLPPAEGLSHNSLVITESPIDALSVLTLMPVFERFPVLSLNGLRPKALNAFLDESPGIRRVFVALDNDDAGAETTAFLEQHLKSQGYAAVVLKVPNGAKDWNDALTANKGSNVR